MSSMNTNPTSTTSTTSRPIHCLGTIDTGYGQASVYLTRYPRGGALAVYLESAEDGEPYATFSVNLAAYGGRLGPEEFFAKTYAENESLVGPLLASGWFEDTGRSFPCGFGQGCVWRLRNAQDVLGKLA